MLQFIKDTLISEKKYEKLMICRIKLDVKNIKFGLPQLQS